MSDAWLTVIAGNAAFAMLLSMVAWVVGRSRRYATLAHLLWIAVLLKLILPPVWHVPYVAIDLPEASQAGESSWQASDELDVDFDVAAVPMIATDASADLPVRRYSWRQVAILVWLIGSGAVFAIGLWRLVAFARLLSLHGTAAPESVCELAQRQAKELELLRLPRIILTSCRLTPLVCFTGRYTTVVLPAQLLRDMPREEWQWVVAHELAHVRRRDHWVRWLEWAALVAMWWNPLAWLARRQLRRVEEVCCDELLLRTFRPERSQYAGSLLHVIEYLVQSDIRPPAVASAIGSGGTLERRIRMIISHAPVSRPSRLAKCLVALCLVTLLPLGVAHSQDFDKVAKRLRKAVKKGEITEAQADAMMAALKQTAKRRRGSGEREEARGEREGRSGEARIKAYLERVKDELAEAVKLGRISEEDAKRRYEEAAAAIKERFARMRRQREDEAEEHEESEFQSALARVRARLARLKEELAEAVESGKMSEEEAGRRFRAAAQEAEEGLRRLRRDDDEDDDDEAEEREESEFRSAVARVRARLARLKEELAEAVEAGKMSEEEAKRRLRGAAQEAEEGLRRLRRDDDEDDDDEAEEREESEFRSAVARVRARLARLKEELAEAVESGKMSEEEAKRRLRGAAQEAEEGLRRLRRDDDEDDDDEAEERERESRGREARACAEQERRRASEAEFAAAVKRIQQELAGAVEAGKLSEEEAEKRLKAAIEELKKRLERRDR